LLAGEWPKWPFAWPAKGYPKLRGRIHPDFIDFMRRAIDVNPRHRFRDAQQMLAEFKKLKYRTLRHAKARRKAA
jgi:eukaryotic-like serine/threonine-protein kinase